MRLLRRPVGRAVTGVAATGAVCLAWAAGYEVSAFRLRRFDVPVLPPDADPLRVLHISDLHMTPGQTRKQRWVASLATLEPDLVVDTGDNLAHVAAVPVVLDALAPLLERPGVFVLGSNDYFGPRPKNPAAYLAGPSKVLGRKHVLPTGDLVRGLTDAGWVDLDNARTTLDVAGVRLDLVGVDDPHMGRDRYLDAAPASPDADLTVGVTHAPYRRVLDAMTMDGADLVLAGHTHGGQLCVPGYGALVTNCDLPTRYAKGLHPWTAGRRRSWLHVSAGLGTSPFAPVRFACPPEATLITLRPRPR
jgi:uncharacterized protein